MIYDKVMVHPDDADGDIYMNALKSLGMDIDVSIGKPSLAAIVTRLMG